MTLPHHHLLRTEISQRKIQTNNDKQHAMTMVEIINQNGHQRQVTPRQAPAPKNL